MSQRIDIATVATLRPYILEKTLDSFCSNLFFDKSRYRHVINVDCIGGDCDPLEVVKISKKFFGNVVYNISKKPSYTKATKWVWKNSSTPFVFFLEDDWVINRKTDIDDMIKIMCQHDDICQVKLFKQNTPSGNVLKVFRSRFELAESGEFFVTDNTNAFSLNPSISRGGFLRSATSFMLDSKNPEKQFRINTGDNEHMRVFLNGWKYALYTRPGDTALVTDIGRTWRDKKGIIKSGGKHFTRWGK